MSLFLNFLHFIYFGDIYFWRYHLKHVHVYILISFIIFILHVWCHPFFSFYFFFYMSLFKFVLLNSLCVYIVYWSKEHFVFVRYPYVPTLLNACFRAFWHHFSPFSANACDVNRSVWSIQRVVTVYFHLTDTREPYIAPYKLDVRDYVCVLFALYIYIYIYISSYWFTLFVKYVLSEYSVITKKKKKIPWLLFPIYTCKLHISTSTNPCFEIQEFVLFIYISVPHLCTSLNIKFSFFLLSPLHVALEKTLCILFHVSKWRFHLFHIVRFICFSDCSYTYLWRIYTTPIFICIYMHVQIKM